MNDCGFSPAVDAPGKASEQEALAEAEHDGMDLFTALRTLFPHDLPSMSAAKRAARRNRAATLLTVNRATFKRKLGALKNILKRNMQDYTKFVTEHV